MIHRTTGQQRKAIAEMNVVPFIDVMLVLLVIFMITTPLLTNELKIELPKVQSSTLPTKASDPLIVTISAEGHFHLNTADNPMQTLSPSRLQQTIIQQLQTTEGKERSVLVQGDKQVAYAKIVEAMAILKEAGVQHIGLLVRPEDSDDHPRA